MVVQLHTAQLREVRRLCRKFTADFYLKRGPFWERVEIQRTLIQQSGEAGYLEEYDHDDSQFDVSDFPDAVPVGIPPSLSNPKIPWQTPLDVLDGRVDSQAVFEGVQVLYYAFEEEFHNLPSIFRQAFFAGCLMYDPPPENMLEYADHANEWLRPRYPLGGSSTVPLPEEALGLPIAWIPYLPDFEIAIQAVERESWELFLSFFEGALKEHLAEIGVDADSIIARSKARARTERNEKLVNSILSRRTGDDPSKWTDRQFLHHVKSTVTPFIRVDEVTSEDDVQRAFSFLRSLQKNENGPKRPQRDELTALQCAVWYDHFGWSQERIAKHFSWKVQYPPAQKPRSETVRQHIVLGRQLLEHK